MTAKAHNERCPVCKEILLKMLAALFGKVEVNYDLNLPSSLQDYKGTNIHAHLVLIYRALQEYRGFDNFVRAKRLPRVDFFLQDRKLVFEFDETQHFTKPRDIALGLYPDEDHFGFSVKKWRNLCQELNRHDSNPPYRDEQRAWYDTLRDLAPLLWDTGQTIRLYSRDFIWCSLDPDSGNDLQNFGRLVSVTREDKR